MYQTQVKLIFVPTDNDKIMIYRTCVRENVLSGKKNHVKHEGTRDDVRKTLS